MATFQKRQGKWRVIIRRKGFPLQTKTFALKSQGEEWARNIERQMDTGRPMTGVVSKDTVKEIFEKYARDVSPTKKGARWEQVRIARICRTAAFIHKLIIKVAPQDIQVWRNQRLTEVSPDSVNREMNLLSAIFTHAIKEWHVALMANPVRLVKRPPKGKPRNRRIRPDELALIWRSREGPRKDSGTVKDYVPWAVELAVETALRFGELTALTWGDVNLEEGWVHVGKSKNGEERYVPLTARAAELLQQLQVQSTESVPGLRVMPCNAATLNTTIREWFTTLGLHDLHFHDTRHEGVSRLSKAFANVVELSAVTGHKDLKALKVYYNPTPQELVAKLRGKA